MEYSKQVQSDTEKYFEDLIAIKGVKKLEDFRNWIETKIDKLSYLDYEKALKGICMGMANCKHRIAISIILEKGLIESGTMNIPYEEYRRDQADVFLSVAMQYYNLL